MSAFQIKPGPLYRPITPVRDPRYLHFVKQFPCVVCGTSRGIIDPAHQGPHGTGQKACDLTAIPECRKCHDKWGSHAPDGVDVPALQRMFQRFYLLRHGGGDWWPRRPDLTLQTCPKCEYEGFAEEIAISGCGKCGYRPESERAA